MKPQETYQEKLQDIKNKLILQNQLLTEAKEALKATNTSLKKPPTGQKKYTVSYDFYGEAMTKEYTSLFDLGMEINRILDETNVLSNTVHITTEDI